MLRVIKDEVCVNHRRLRWITQFEALIIFTIIYALTVSLCIQYQEKRNRCQPDGFLLFMLFNYKISRNEVNIKLRNAKRNYYSTQIAGLKLDPKRAWKSINNLLGRQNKPTVVNELNLNDKNLTTPKDIAEGFNDYF